MGDGHGRDRGPQGQAAVHREVREVQDPEGEVHPEHHDPVDEPLFQGSDEGEETHANVRAERQKGAAGPRSAPLMYCRWALVKPEAEL